MFKLGIFFLVFFSSCHGLSLDPVLDWYHCLWDTRKICEEVTGCVWDGKCMYITKAWGWLLSDNDTHCGLEATVKYHGRDWIYGIKLIEVSVTNTRNEVFRGITQDNYRGWERFEIYPWRTKTFITTTWEFPYEEEGVPHLRIYDFNAQRKCFVTSRK